MKRKMIVRTFLALFLISAGSLGFKFMEANNPAIECQKPEAPMSMVRPVPVSAGTEIRLTGKGTVRPVSEIALVPEVGGKVVHVSPNLINGGAFKAGERLMAIEPADYRIAVTLAEASVKDALSRFELARQESEAACNEWEQLHSGRKPPQLVARLPQLDAARGRLKARQANLEKARLDLKRTEITAPFNGRVGAENIAPGEYVNPGESIATLYCTDAAEIVVPMEAKTLNWIDVPGFTTNDCAGSLVEVTADVAGRKRTWTGEVARVGKIDEETRMIDVIIRIEDPYATRPPLSIGQFAEIRIKEPRGRIGS